MDLRNFGDNLSPHERINTRRDRISHELRVELGETSLRESQVGTADEKNCEQMFGAVPVPVGLAGPLKIHFSSHEERDVYVPLATTEGALIASVNRGAKALSFAGGVKTTTTYVGITRSIALATKNPHAVRRDIVRLAKKWKKVAEGTSAHLKVLSYTIDTRPGHVFLTIAADTSEAMGMNMITIAAQHVGQFLEQNLDVVVRTVAGNVDSDKKPSRRTKKLGRGFRVSASADVSRDAIRDILKTTPEALIETARAKLSIGSKIAGALGTNLHAANIVSALYLATGQDVAHTVEGSLSDTRVIKRKDGISITIEMPAVLVGVRGGGTGLPAQKQCLDLLLKPTTSLKKTQQLAETVAGAVLAGELSLLSAQASQTLAKTHQKLAR